MKLILLNFFLMLNLALLWLLSHPLYMSINLLMMILINLINLNTNMISNWVNYIFTMVYLGGLLILFIYMSSMIPNIFFSYPMNMILKTLLIISMMSVMMSNNFITFNSLFTNKLNQMSFNTDYMTVMMILTILLIMLMTSVWLSKHNVPMRSM